MRRALKWTAIAFAAAACVAAGAVFVWQPDPVKLALTRFALRKISESGPYRVEVAAVRGNFFRRVEFDGVSVWSDQPEMLLARIRALSADLQWRELVRRRIEFRALELREPEVRLVLGPDRRLILPRRKAPSGQKASSWAFAVGRLRVRDGSASLVSRAVRPVRRIRLKDLELDARLEPSRLDIGKLFFRLGKGSAALNGSADFAKASADLDLRTRRFPVDDALAVAAALPPALRLVHSGRWTVRKRGEDLSLRSEGELDGAPLEADFVVAGRRPDYRGRLDLSGLSAPSAWASPALHPSDRISCRLELSGKGFSPRGLQARGQVVWNSRRSGGEGREVVRAEVDLLGGAGPVQLQAETSGAKASAQGRVDLAKSSADLDYSLSVDSSAALAALNPALAGLEGSMDSKGRVSGNWKAPRIEGDLSGKDLAWKGRAVGQVRASFRRESGAAAPVFLQASASGVRWSSGTSGPWDISDLSVRLDGARDRWQSRLGVHFANDGQVRFQGPIRKERNLWKLAWAEKGLEVDLPNGQRWSAPKAGSLAIGSGNRAVLRDLALASGAQAIEIDGGLSKAGPEDLRLALREVSVAPWLVLLGKEPMADGVVQSSVTLNGSWEAPRGRFFLDLTRGSVRKWPVERVLARVRLEPPWIEVERFRLRSMNQTVTVEGRVPMGLAKGRAAPGRTWDLRVDAPELNPQILGSLVPSVEVAPGGTTTVHLVVGGIWPDLTVDGRLFARMPRLTVKPIDLKIENLIADVVSRKSVVEIRRFSGKTKDGEIRASGRSRLPELKYALRGRNFRLQQKDQWAFSSDFDLRLAGRLDRPDLTGQIKLTDGFYNRGEVEKKAKKEKKKKGGEAREPAPAEPGGESGPSLWQRTAMEVRLFWPRDFWYRDELTGIETKGDLHFRKKPDEKDLRLMGSVETVRGTYVYSGRNFRLQSGLFTFTGPVADPLIDVTALYKIEPTEITLRITGSAQHPQLALSSNPPLPEQDVLSLLVFGRPVEDLKVQSSGNGTQETGGQASARQKLGQVAGEALGNYLSAKISERGLQKLNLDLFRIQPTGQGTNVTVGRYIGEKLFVSYRQSFGLETGRLLSAEYYLTPAWTVQAEAGTDQASHLDFQFRYPLNHPGRNDLGPPQAPSHPEVRPMVGTGPPF